MGVRPLLSELKCVILQHFIQVFRLRLWYKGKSLIKFNTGGGSSGGAERHPLTSTGVLHYQVQSLLCLYDLKELHWRWRQRESDTGGGAEVRDNGAIRAAGVVDGGGLTYVGVIQQLHDPHLPEELQHNKRGAAGRQTRRASFSFARQEVNEPTFDVAESVHFLFVGEGTGGKTN